MAESLQDTLMPLAKLKQGLATAERGSVGCAFGLTKDKKEVLLLVDKTANAKKVAAKLKAEGKDALVPATLRYGEVRIDAADSGTVQFHVNKAEAGGTLPLMVRLIKKAGYSGLVIMPDLADEDGDGDEGAPEAAAPTAEAPAAPPPPPPVDGKMRLTALVQRIGAVVAAAPGRKAELLGLAKEAQAALVAGQSADDKIAALAAALSRPAAVAMSGEVPGAKDGPVVALGKSGIVWRLARKQLEGKLDQLKSAILQAYADEPEVQKAIQKNFGELDQAFDGFGTRLEDSLDDAVNAADPQKRQAAVLQSRDVIADYSKRVASDPLLQALDDNPFGVQLGFKDTLSKVLSAVDGVAAKNAQ